MASLIRKNEFDLYECIDEDTGEVIWTQIPSKQKQRRLSKGLSLPLKNIPDPRTNTGRPTNYPYSPYYAQAIICLMCEGFTISDIGRMEGMPPATTIYYWVKRYKDFSRLIYQVREIKKELILDRIFTQLNILNSQPNLKINKFKIKTLQWAYDKT